MNLEEEIVILEIKKSDLTTKNRYSFSKSISKLEKKDVLNCC